MTIDPAEAERLARDSWQAQAPRYALLFDIVLLIASSKSLDELLAQSINKIKWVFDFDRCTLALRNGDDDSYCLDTLLDTRRDAEEVKLESVPLSDGLPGEVIQTGQMQFFNDLQSSLDEISSIVDPALVSGELGSLLAIPLEAYGRVLGSLSFSAKRANCFSDEDVKVAMQFATHLGLAIDRWQATDALQVAHAEAEGARTQLFEALSRSVTVSRCSIPKIDR